MSRHTPADAAADRAKAEIGAMLSDATKLIIGLRQTAVALNEYSNAMTDPYYAIQLGAAAHHLTEAADHLAQMREKPKREPETQDYPTTASQLQDSLDDLETALKNAAGAGIPEPAATTVAEARRALQQIQQAAPGKYLVYLMPDGAIAIDARGVKPDGVFITLHDDGSACCCGETDGKHWHRKYANSQDVPDRLLLDELQKLENAMTAGK